MSNPLLDAERKHRLKKVESAAKIAQLFSTNATVHACFQYYLNSECSWEDALTNAVVALAEENKKAYAYLFEMSLRLPFEVKV